jgi:(p)ppGpp synthase/HD superfamily hydrolase
MGLEDLSFSHLGPNIQEIAELIHERQADETHQNRPTLQQRLEADDIGRVSGRPKPYSIYRKMDRKACSSTNL